MYRTFPGKHTFLHQADDSGLGGTPPAAVAAATTGTSTPPVQPSDWEGKYRGLSRTFEQQRQELEALKGQTGAQLSELQAAMKTMTDQMQTLAQQNAELEQRRLAAEQMAAQQALDARKRDLIAKQAPHLAPMAAYIPTATAEEEQAKAVADFIAAVNGIATAPAMPPTPPTSSPPAPATPPTPSLAQVQQSWIDAILANKKDEAKAFEAQFSALVNADPRISNAFSEQVVVRQGVSTKLGV